MVIRKPTCFDCIHGEFIEGYAGSFWEPEEPDTIECQHKTILDQWDEKYISIFEEVNYDEDELPNRCGCFKPKMIKQCALESCQKEMNTPVYTWKLWAQMDKFGTMKGVCSEECKDAIELMEKIMRSIEQENKDDELEIP